MEHQGDYPVNTPVTAKGGFLRSDFEPLESYERSVPRSVTRVTIMPYESGPGRSAGDAVGAASGAHGASS